MIRRLEVLLAITPATDGLPGMSDDAVRQELRWGLRRFLERAVRSPTALIVEDIHWAEPTLLSLIEHLAEAVQAPLTIVCAARPELLASRAGWGGGKRNATAIDLQPLSPEDTGTLISELLRVEALSPHVRAEVVERSEGNPLYVEEFLRMLIDGGQLWRRGRKWVATDSAVVLKVPLTIHGVIAARLDQLPAEVKSTLQAGAVVGRSFWTDALEGVGRAAGSLDAELGTAVERDLVTEIDERGLAGGRGYRFRHVLLRDVAYSGLHKQERQRMHLRLADWLGGRSADRRPEYEDLITYHVEQSFLLARELGSVDAGDLGQRAFAQLAAAIQRSSARADRATVLGLCARAKVIADGAAVADADRAEIDGIAALNRNYIQSTAATMADLERAVDRMRAHPPTRTLVMALNRLGIATVHDDLAQAERLFDEALAAAHAHGDPAYVARALLAYQELGWFTMDGARVWQVAKAVHDYRHEHGMSGPAGDPTAILARQSERRGRFSEAAGYRDEYEQNNHAARGLFFIWSAALSRGARALAISDAEAGRRHFTEALALARELGDRERIAEANAGLADAELACGDLAAARDLLRDMIAMAEGLAQGAAMVPEYRGRLARVLLGLGDVEAALVEAERAVAEVIPDHRYTQASSRHSLALVRAALGRPEEALSLWSDAIARLDPVWEGIFLAEVRLELGRFLLAQGRRAEACAELKRARDFYADPLAFRKRELIEALLCTCDEVPAT